VQDATPREIDDDAPVPAKLRFARTLLGLEYNARLRVVEPHDFGSMNGTSAARLSATRGRRCGWRPRRREDRRLQGA